MKPLDVKIAIYEAHAAKKIPSSCTAQDVAGIVGCTSRQAGRYMKAMGFRLISKQKCRKDGKKWVMVPSVYERPYSMPTWAQIAKKCRDRGMSVGQTERAIKQALELEIVLERAMDNLILDGVLWDKRGAMTREIRRIMRRMLSEAIPNSDLARELAKALGESADANGQYLLNMAENYMRAATRRANKKGR